MNNLKELLDKIWAISPLKLVALAIERDFWDFVGNSNGITISDIQTKYGWKERPLRQVLKIFKDLDLIKQENQMIFLTSISCRWLVKNSKNYCGDFIIRANNLAKAYDIHMEKLLKQDTPDDNMLRLTKNAFGGNFSETSVFARSMDAMTREFANEILEKIHIESIKKCLDIGAGLGIMSRIISDSHPEIEFTVVELPGVAQLLKKRISHFEHSNMFRVVECDWREMDNHIESDSKYDLIILSQVLHEEKRNNAEMLIEKCSNMLSSNGLLAIVGFLNDEKIITHLFSLNLLMEIGSDNLTEIEISSIAEKYDVKCISTYYSKTSGRTLWLGKKILNWGKRTQDTPEQIME